jgi:hypothetical protein
MASNSTESIMSKVTRLDDYQIEIDVHDDGSWPFVNLSRHPDGSLEIHVDSGDGLGAPDACTEAEVVIDAKAARALRRFLKRTE